MNNLLSDSFELPRGQPSGNGDIELGIQPSASSAELGMESFFKQVQVIEKQIEKLSTLLQKLQNANEESKAVTKAASMKAIKQRMEKDIDEVGKIARQAKSKVEELDRDNLANRQKPGCGKGSAVDRSRTATTVALKKKLKERMSEFQFFYFDSIESLPVELQKPEDLKPLNSCHDAQISVLGLNLQKKLDQVIGSMAGAGALGCEFLKNVALIGVCCSRNGKLTTTDDDVFKKSKLSRQFMFRDWNIGQSNSTVAATAASTFNPALHVEVLQNRVCPVPEDVFNDAFYERRDSVVNSLDSVNARLYAEYFQKLLLESGTLGTKCNTQMVIPHLTENYGVSRDPPERHAPMCTVHSFPHNIDHWPTRAHSELDGWVYKTPSEVNNFLYASDAQARDELERALECLDKERFKTFEDCVTWAWLKFEDHFSNRVKQLIYTFPDDAATSTGAPFWSAPKWFPQPLEFSASNPAHLNFIMDVSILRAQTFGITVPDWAKSPKKLADAVSQVMVPDFEPKKDVNIVTDEKATSMSTASTDDATAINDLLPSWKSFKKSCPQHT